MELGDAAIRGFDIVGGLTEIDMWANKDDKTFEELKYDLLKGHGKTVEAKGNIGDNGYVPARYYAGAPIRISGESMHRMRRAYRAAWYHKTCGLPLTQENMAWAVVEPIGEQILAIEKMMVESRNTKPIPLKNGDHPL